MTTTTFLLNLTVMAVLITTVASQQYTNHTVGSSMGWLFDAKNNISATNYSSWASNQTFNLGDYLIFNTTTNQTVILTYNDTTFNNCTTDDASDDDTFQFSGGNSEFGKSLTIAVPLTVVGPNFFFSDAEDGIQCQRGMAFQILVNHGLGLPPSLNQPPPPPYVAPPSPDTAQSPPVTIAGGSPSLDNGASSRLINLRFLLPSLLLCLASVLV
ncbi:cucumber peeling cupredoxin-like [Pistacia vera]|uniref:cucumber peeling cupredoxin-like n=1 Tax=Pistacia vera TaxID=55513 RepID=UPI0012637BEB|nr:cucumber peeling cupredoxin-like [Pistacia vera]XP_031272721.1 cucumber peeling cupredoxin-like [Pistacia vera]